MKLGERLRTFLPESMQPRLEVSSYSQLIKIAKEKGVKDFVAIWPIRIFTRSESGLRYATVVNFETRGGRDIRFAEIHETNEFNPELDSLTGYDVHELKNLLTASDRQRLFLENGILARITRPLGLEDLEKSGLSPRSMDKNLQDILLRRASKKGLESFPLAESAS